MQKLHVRKAQNYTTNPRLCPDTNNSDVKSCKKELLLRCEAKSKEVRQIGKVKMYMTNTRKIFQLRRLYFYIPLNLLWHKYESLTGKGGKSKF